MSICSRSHRSKFSPSEDAKLQYLVAQYGTYNWNAIAAKMENRNSRQCHDRWFNYLDPHRNTSEWTKEEDNMLLKLYYQIGCKWVKIAECLPGRTDVMVKNRFNVICRHERRKARFNNPMLLQQAPTNLEIPNVASECNLKSEEQIKINDYFHDSFFGEFAMLDDEI